MKPIIYSEIIPFDQETQYVKQSEPVDMGDYIFVGLEVHGVVNELVEIAQAVIADLESADE